MEELDRILKPVREEGGVEVMKASAGSGKTFSLAREYIRLLLTNRDEDHAYRHILAVTFTNKATEEMKSRIIDSLDTLARYPEHSLYRDYLMKHCGFQSEEELQKASKRALADILGDYGAFSVSTIDHFFQRVLRAFSREVGQFAEYQVELNRDALVAEAVDRVLDSLSEGDGALLDWLSRTSVESIASGDGYRLRDGLGTFADGYMSEDYRDKAEALGMDRTKAFSEENLKALRQVCDKIVKDYDTGLKAAAAAALSAAEAQPKPGKNLISRLQEIARNGLAGTRKEFTSEPPKFWTDALEAGIVTEVAAYGLEPLKIYRTAQILRTQISVFRVADALDRQFQNLLKEKNVLSLDDTNSILRDIIGGSDAPFIYEKVGVRYRHFLLDEFQDTSSTQWDNFRPLLANSISEGCYNLIVGDVKQSIYRWRSARWDILDQKVQDELRRTALHPLLNNRRSAKEIVGFNNSFYKTWAEKLDIQLGSEIAGSAAAEEASRRSIADIYSDVEQVHMSRFTVPGSVEVTYCEKQYLYDYTVAAVKEAMARGFTPRDIAVIVRTNAMGQEVAARLIREQFHVITNDSLRIGSGWSVRTLVARLYLIDNPSDRINSFHAGEFKPEALDSCQSLTDLCERILAGLPADRVNADTLYVLAFMDLVRDFVASNGNSLHSFLKYWAEEGMRRSISSPEGTDAITIITIHSVKGLGYPCVILPVGAEFWIYSLAKFWEAPDVKGTPLEKVEPALYNTGLSSGSRDTLFADNYCRELRMTYIDKANVWYVATTRAAQAMHIIGIKPSDAVCRRAKGDPWARFGGFGEALYEYCTDAAQAVEAQPLENTDGFLERYLFGTVSPKEELPGRAWIKPMPPKEDVDLKYYSAGEAGANARPQVRIKTDSADFFDPEGETGIAASRRIRGTVLHKILETVAGPEDLPRSVAMAVDAGLLSADQGREAEVMLAHAIGFVTPRGWFPGDAARLLDEREIITPDGATLRPDRVVLKDDGSVEIVDYKFAEEKGSYIRQVRRYAQLYRAMGYKDVKAFLWYVDKDEVLQA
ncbi:MAG: UvrD-helicase domain-containing protein [Bacteroidales bacterium]|nr:UvrD-helicase domain-containing protein [Bacteroidales bacterium]